MKAIKTLQTLKFRMTLRKELSKQTYDLVLITKEEAIRELERRNKRK